MLKRVVRLVADRPVAMLWIAVGAWLVHASMSWATRSQNIWARLAVANGVSVYLGLMTFASLLAGAIGTVTTLGLSSRTAVFRKLRASGGEPLRASWPAMLASALMAATSGLAAAVLATMGYGWLSPWFFELGALGVLHAAWRLVWLLTQMIAVVQLEDEREIRMESTISTTELFAVK